MTEWKDEEISRLLRETPRARAGGDFTDRVMARLDRPRRRPGVGRASVLSVVVVAGVAAVVASGRFARQEDAVQTQQTGPEVASSDSLRDAKLERLERLQAEYRALEEELRELRVLATENGPVLDLGGTDEVDFVLDVRELATRPSVPASPASHMERMR